MLFERYEPAELEYAGTYGISRRCCEAVMRLLQYGHRISVARILSHAQEHCLLLTLGEERLIAIKSGFTSGYNGEGPRTLALVLQLLDEHGAEIDEFDVGRQIFGRVNKGALRRSDLNALAQGRPVRPQRWHDYLYGKRSEPGSVWKSFPPIMPFALIDSRIVDLAIDFWSGPDARLVTAYRRLEDLIRKSTGTEEHGAKLFAHAFGRENAPLSWPGVNSNEQAGRVNLFTGAYMAYRNRRAHREQRDNEEHLLSEFLLLNHLYQLERQAEVRPRQ